MRSFRWRIETIGGRLNLREKSCSEFIDYKHGRVNDYKIFPKLPIENSLRAKVLDFQRNDHDSERTRWVVRFGGPPPTRAFDAALLLD